MDIANIKDKIRQSLGGCSDDVHHGDPHGQKPRVRFMDEAEMLVKEKGLEILSEASSHTPASSVSDQQTADLKDIMTSIAKIENKLKFHSDADSKSDLSTGSSPRQSHITTSSSLLRDYRALQHAVKQAALEIRQELPIISAGIVAVSSDLDELRSVHIHHRRNFVDSPPSVHVKHKIALVASIDKMQNELNVLKSERDEALDELSRLKKEMFRREQASTASESRMEEVSQKLVNFHQKVAVALSGRPQQQLLELQSKADGLEAELVVALDEKYRLQKENDVLRDSLAALSTSHEQENSCKVLILEKAWKDRDTAHSKLRIDMLRKIKILEDQVKAKDLQLEIHRDSRREVSQLEQELQRQAENVEKLIRATEELSSPSQSGATDIDSHTGTTPKHELRSQEASTTESVPWTEFDSFVASVQQGLESMLDSELQREPSNSHYADDIQELSPSVRSSHWLPQSSTTASLKDTHSAAMDRSISATFTAKPDEDFNACIAGLSALDTAMLNQQAAGGLGYRNM